MFEHLTRAAMESNDRPVLPRRPNYGPWIRRAVVFVSCALALNALIGERGLAETIRARRQLQRQTMELDRLKQENAVLVETARALESDRHTIESIARKELGLVRKGEVLVVLKDIPAQ
jgi:cell division protein FtsB